MQYRIASGPAGIVGWLAMSVKDASQLVSHMVDGRPVIVRQRGEHLYEVYADGWCYPYEGWTMQDAIATMMEDL